MQILPNLETLELDDLQRLIDRCKDELERRTSAPISEEDALLSLSAQLAAHRRSQDEKERDLRDLFQ